MTRTSLPRVFALAPIGNEGIAIAAAACRAKALGWVDLSSERCPSTAECFARIGKLTADPFGIRVHANAILSGPLLEPAIHSPAAVWVPAWSLDPESLPELAARIASTNRIAIAEVTTRAEARSAHAAGFHGLVLSGHEAGGWCGSESSFVLLQGVLAESDLPVWVRGGIGPSVAAGCIAAGAAGVVLDGALLLSRESPLTPVLRDRVADGMAVKPLWSLRARAPALRVFAAAGSESLVRLKAAANQDGPSWLEAVDRERRLDSRPVRSRRSGRRIRRASGSQVRDDWRHRPGRRASHLERAFRR